MASLGTVREQLFATMTPSQVKVAGIGIVFGACAVTMVASLLLGGGTRGGFLSDAILELLAIPAFLISVASLVELRWSNADIGRRARGAVMFCVVIAFLPLLQLLPLPPWIWTRLPGREGVMAVFDLLGGQRPWMPVSVSPNSTWLGVLSLLPPFAIFFGAIQLGYRERRWLSLVVIAIGVVSAFVGLIQVVQGPTSVLRFFAVTNSEDAVGFFANRNHLAALLYTVLLFAAAWAIDVAFKSGSWTGPRSLEPARIFALTLTFVVFIILIASEAMTRSRAGVVLTIGALAGVLTLASTDRRTSAGATPGRLLLGAIALAIMLIVQFGLYRVLSRFAIDPLDDARIRFARGTIRAALAFTPFGSGVGTFVPVYAMFERPSDTPAGFYANHAHNDILELWLETGLVGVGLLCLFLIWLGFRFVKLWWRPIADMNGLDLSLARAALMIIGLLFVHSFVDYPLRTGAIMAIFAFSCALLIEPLTVAGSARGAPPGAAMGTPRRKELETSHAMATAPGPDPRPSRGLSQRMSAAPSLAKPPNQPRRPTGRWGDDVDWPEAWREPGIAQNATGEQVRSSSAKNAIGKKT